MTRKPDGPVTNILSSLSILALVAFAISDSISNGGSAWLLIAGLISGAVLIVMAKRIDIRIAKRKNRKAVR